MGLLNCELGKTSVILSYLSTFVLSTVPPFRTVLPFHRSERYHLGRATFIRDQLRYRTNTCDMFPAKSEEFLTPITCVSLTFSGAKIRNFEFLPSAPSSPPIVFLARSTTIDSHRNPVALPSITQFFSPTHHSRMFWPTPELLEPSKLIVFGFRIV